MSESAPRYVIGIDLGTTHTVIAYVDTRRSHDGSRGAESGQTRPQIEVFPVPQLVSPGEVLARPLLPSARYHPAPDELSEDESALGFDAQAPDLPRAVVGALAQQLGAKTTGRLVTSAKSWLCHAGVDREAHILPWGASNDVPKVSPVAASQSYLSHVRAAWDAAHPNAKLAKQEVVLTVPASFDEVARALTLKAAHAAGIPKLRLLEEPQAAFYDWLDRHRDTLAQDLGDAKLALVVDVGGGTTDLTLIQSELRESGPRLTRIAVGEHLMLGGDNMDLTLARKLESKLSPDPSARLSAGRFSQLLEQCRRAKEQLLGPDAPDHVTVSLLGTGAKLIGGTRSAQLTRAEVEATIVEGFTPEVGLHDAPQQRKGALLEFGLPYVADPAISRHVAQFLTRHRAVTASALGLSKMDAEASPQSVLPDAVLFNGGVFQSTRLKQRLSDVLGGFRAGEALRELDNPSPDLAVARGAVAYGLSRRGVGLRIGGGSARSYYLLVDAAPTALKAVCLLPKGSEEGEERVLTGRTFLLRVGEPVRFRVLTSTRETAHLAGELVDVSPGAFEELPEIAAVLDARAGDDKDLKVQLHAGLTEVGTLEMSCVAREDPGRRYKLEFQLRGKTSERPEPVARVTQLHPRFRQATDLLQAYFGKSNQELEGKRIKTLRSDLEKLLGPREQWDTALLRELFGSLLAGKKRRRRSADHERLWLMLAGYCLRPGYGYPLDDYRVEQVWGLLSQGVQFAPDAQVWSQWWILWRRIAGGLSADRQEALLKGLYYYLEPQGPRPRTRPKGPKALGLEDMVRLAGALERVSPESKVRVGDFLLKRLEKGEVSVAAAWWSIGRLGARAQVHGSTHHVVPPHVASRWLERALATDLSKTEQAAFAVAHLARLTQDRTRDLPDDVRERAAQALAASGAFKSFVTLVREGGDLSEAEQGRVFGESLPQGLRLSP